MSVKRNNKATGTYKGDSEEKKRLMVRSAEYLLVMNDGTKVSAKRFIVKKRTD